MTLLKSLKISAIGVMCTMILANVHAASNYGIQSAWDNPNANMASGSIKPGYTQLAWETGTVLPIKLRNGMVTMVNLPNGEQIEDAVVGNDGFFSIEGAQGTRTLYITPAPDNMGSDTNMIVTGKSGNVYTFYLRSEPANASEITYSQVDVVLDNNARLPNVVNPSAVASSGTMNSIFKKTPKKSSTIGVDGEDYDWIKTMKIDPSEFRFDLDIFVPNPDDYVIAPERVWRDRVFTYIDFGDKVISMTQRPVVSLLVEGGESPVGFRTDGQDGRLLIVEAVGDMVLRSGQRIVCIKKRSKPFLIADTASVMALAEANVAQSMLSGQSLNNVLYNSDQAAMNSGMGGYTATPMQIGSYATQPMQTMPISVPATNSAMMMNMYGNGGGTTSGLTMLPTERNTAGSYLPQNNIPLISSNQGGVAVELRSDSSVKALDDYWAELMAKFSGNDGKGLLTKYKDNVFYAVDEQGVGELGASSSAARLYRLRIGPMPDIDTAQQLCDQLLKFSGASCQVVRIQ
ncbi:MAG: TrbG/VirB9 family P-type conjugative transfer protein [Alphaproteobacteria bacterium]|nr:TrbG/VirB9 family P-type conjugative transfer protein [Alphaproteobacteria bacterium]